MASAIDADDIAYSFIRLQEITVFGDSTLMEESLCCFCFCAIVINNER